MPDNRPLGNLETAMEILNIHAKTWNLVTISRINGNLQAAVIRQALDIIQSRHPHLNSHIIHFKNRFYFQTAGTEKIPLRTVINLEEEQWQEVVNQEMNQAIDSHKCLMRVVLVSVQGKQNISYLITTLHHAISDGLSSIQLHSEILKYCQKIISADAIKQVTNLETLPPAEKLLPEYKQDWRGNISSIFLFLKLGFRKLYHRPKTLGFEKYAPISKRSCQIIHRQINSDLTEKFVQSCQQENTTVHGAISAILMLTVAKKITKYNQHNIRVNCLSHLDLRRRLKPPINQENLAALATSIIGFHTIKQNTSIWELAREVKQNLEIGIKHGELFNMVLIAKHLINFCFLFPQQVAATVSVSNVGKVNIPENYGELELAEISFAGSHSMYAGMFVINVATFQGQMLLNFVFSQPSISRNTMEDLVNQVVSYILNISSNSLQIRGA
ncbi:phthiocerol/phthiodiolone dimycocerosyl transferase family protein [Anabaena sp. UHCC 0451]|uniref:phthiocerol/phthiodiolone dimycocerosyl transferase family protein n=1 Tax=Anabaena sp. UHCC 0451 TaxID=2055235 RepID=UPI002B22020F|nr:condensation domain-containing protein [Anabaena sp. UHCC 0451]MEA5575867.1 condensation domain-containing protein [Anabaena sp. UHCC 0451]